MTQIKIVSRWDSSKVLWQGDSESVRDAVIKAYKEHANLRDAKLDEIKKDYFERMALQPNEVTGLYKAILDGEIDGSSYQGECACFVGTIAKVAGVRHDALINLKPDASSLTERWYLGIRKGDTPDNNPVSAITAEWTKEFMEREGIAVPVRKVVWEVHESEGL